MLRQLLVIASGVVLSSSGLGMLGLPTKADHQTPTFKNSNLDFNTAYRNSHTGFAHLAPQYKHEIKYNDHQNLWNGPIYSVYWGRDYDYPYSAQQIMKDSPISNFTLAFLNPLSNEDETGNFGAGYIDSFQEIRALGGNVTVSFGGATPKEDSFFNYDPSPAVMYEHLKELAIGYNINSFDFDIEGAHTLYGNDLTALCMALKKLETVLQTQYHRTMHVRFTVGPVDEFMAQDIANIYGTNFIWNDMTNTSYYGPHHAGVGTSPVPFLKSDLESLKQVKQFSQMSDNEVYHHLGFTTAIDAGFMHASYDEVKDAIPWTIQNQLGLISIWNVGIDHMSGSPLSPTETNPSDKTDFYFSNLIQKEFANNNYWDPSIYHSVPGQVTGLRLYSKSKMYISLKWNPVANAKYYNLEDSQGNIISQVQRCFGSLSFREYPQLPVVGDHTFRVVAVNAKGAGQASQSLTVNIAPNLIDNQIEYYDANINYPNLTYPGQATPTTFIPYVYYQGKIYQDINHSKAGLAMDHSPATDKQDWKLLGTATDPQFGLTANRLQDLANFEWDKNINNLYPLQYVDFTKGEDTALKIPTFNQFVVPIWTPQITTVANDPRRGF